MKKILLNETEKKAIIAKREKAILESFAKTFNKIKRIDENELGGEQILRAQLHTLVGNEMKLEKRASMSGAPHHEEEHRQAKQALVDFLRQNPSMNEFLETVENHFLDKLYESNSIDENDHEDWDLENEKQKYGVNPEIEPSGLQGGE